MDIKKCIELRSSSRKYISDLIPAETIIDIINAGKWAPSPKNRQPWRFAVLQGESKSDFVKKCREQLSKQTTHIDYLMHNEYA